MESRISLVLLNTLIERRDSSAVELSLRFSSVLSSSSKIASYGMFSQSQTSRAYSLLRVIYLGFKISLLVMSSISKDRCKCSKISFGYMRGKLYPASSSIFLLAGQYVQIFFK